MSSTKPYVDPKNDFAFKKIFGSEEHKNITISFINSLLELTGNKQITEIQFLNTEQAPLIMQEKKENFLDILCTDQNKSQYIVEMQVEPVKAFINRMVYYGSKTYAIQLGTSAPYDKLMPVIVIAIINYALLPEEEGYKSIHKITSVKTNRSYFDQLTFVLAELKKFNKKQEELLTTEDKWLYFIKEISNQESLPKSFDNKEFKEACFAAELLKWSEPEVAAYHKANIRATDLKGAIELAKEAGIALGKEEGIALGEKIGEERGKEAGMHEKALEVARQLLADDMSPEKVARITQLTVEEIQKLNKKL